MSVTEDSNTHSDPPVLEGGVLAALPRARPQRASARRVDTREKTAGSKTKTAAGNAKKVKKAKAATKPAVKAKPGSSAPVTRTRDGKAKPEPRAAVERARDERAKPKRAREPAVPSEPRAPTQGYEPEEEIELGATVNPPSGVELLESLTEIVSELAGSSLTAGGRLLKDAFSVLRRP